MKHGVFLLDRPEAANALDVKTARNLADAIKQLVKSEAPGLVIASKSPRVFCGGGDIKAYSKMKTKAQGVQANRQIRKILQSFPTAPLTIISAVEGACIGGGCELILACDRIICGEGARFAFKQASLSLTPGWGGAQRLLGRVRASVAFDWLTSGRWVGADEAFRCGLVEEVVPAGNAQKRAQEFMEERGELPQSLLGHVKKIIFQSGRGEEKVFESLWFQPAHRRTLSSRS